MVERHDGALAIGFALRDFNLCSTGSQREWPPRVRMLGSVVVAHGGGNRNAKARFAIRCVPERGGE